MFSSISRFCWGSTAVTHSPQLAKVGVLEPENKVSSTSKTAFEKQQQATVDVLKSHIKQESTAWSISNVLTGIGNMTGLSSVAKAKKAYQLEVMNAGKNVDPDIEAFEIVGPQPESKKVPEIDPTIIDNMLDEAARAKRIEQLTANGVSTSNKKEYAFGKFNQYSEYQEAVREFFHTEKNSVNIDKPDLLSLFDKNASSQKPYTSNNINNTNGLLEQLVKDVLRKLNLTFNGEKIDITSIKEKYHEYSGRDLEFYVAQEVCNQIKEKGHISNEQMNNLSVFMNQAAVSNASRILWSHKPINDSEVEVADGWNILQLATSDTYYECAITQTKEGFAIDYTFKMGILDASGAREEQIVDPTTKKPFSKNVTIKSTVSNEFLANPLQNDKQTDIDMFVRF